MPKPRLPLACAAQRRLCPAAALTAKAATSTTSSTTWSSQLSPQRIARDVGAARDAVSLLSPSTFSPPSSATWSQRRCVRRLSSPPALSVQSGRAHVTSNRACSTSGHVPSSSPTSSSYKTAVECDAYGYDTSALAQFSRAGHSRATPLPNKANVVVVRALTAEKHKLTRRMESILASLIDAHVAQWHAYHSSSSQDADSVAEEAAWPLLIASISFGPQRQVQRDQRKLDALLAKLPNIPPGSVFVCCMTEAQGKSVGGPFAKPSRRVAVSTKGGRAKSATAHTADERDEINPLSSPTDAAPLSPVRAAAAAVAAVVSKAVVGSGGGVEGTATPADVEAEGVLDVARGDVPLDGSLDPFLDALDMDDAAMTDIRSVEEAEAHSQLPEEPEDVRREKDDILDCVDDDALVLDWTEDEHARPFRNVETDGVVEPVLASEKEEAVVGNLPLVRVTRRPKKWRRLKRSASPTETRTTGITAEATRFDWTEAQGLARSAEAQNTQSSAPPPPLAAAPRNEMSATATTVPRLRGDCATAHRFTGVKTVYLSDVLHSLLPAVANVLVVDRRAVWNTTAHDSEASTDDKTEAAVASVKAQVERAVAASEDAQYGPLLLHPGAYALTEEVICDANEMKTRWMPTVLLFQTNLLPLEAEAAQAVLTHALRHVRHVTGRLSAVYVVPRRDADAAFASLDKAGVESRERLHASSYRPLVTDEQDSPFSQMLAGASTAPVKTAATKPTTAEARTAANVALPDAVAKVAAASAHKEASTASPHNPSVSSDSIRHSGIHLPKLSLFSWTSEPAPTLPIVPRAVETQPEPSDADSHHNTAAEKEDAKEKGEEETRGEKEDDAVRVKSVSTATVSRKTPVPTTSRARMTRGGVRGRGPTTARIDRNSAHTTSMAHSKPALGGFMLWVPSASTPGEAQTSAEWGFGVDVDAVGTIPTAVQQCGGGGDDVECRAPMPMAVPTTTAAMSVSAAHSHTPLSRNAAKMNSLDEEKLIDDAVRAVLAGNTATFGVDAATLIPTARVRQPSPVSVASRTHSSTKARAAVAQGSAAPSDRHVTTTKTTTPAAAAAAPEPARMQKEEPLDYDTILANIIQDVAATAEKSPTPSARTTSVTKRTSVSRASRDGYSWSSTRGGTAKSSGARGRKGKGRGPVATKTRAAARTAPAHSTRKPKTKAELARMVAANQKRAAASRRRIKAAAAAVESIRSGVNEGKPVRFSPAFALPSPEHCVCRASKAELKVLKTLMDSRAMPSAKDMESIPPAQAARLGRAARIYPSVNCHGNTKEKIQILSWFPPERFKETYRHVSTSARAAPSTVVLMAQRIISPKLFVSQAHENELVVRTVGAIVYACAKNESMHPHRRHRIAGGRILCFVFRNELTLHACERQQDMLEKLLRTVKGFEKAKVFVTTPLPSTKKRVMA